MHITLSWVKPKVKPQQKIRQNRADKKKGFRTQGQWYKKNYKSLLRQHWKLSISRKQDKERKNRSQLRKLFGKKPTNFPSKWFAQNWVILLGELPLDWWSFSKPRTLNWKRLKPARLKFQRNFQNGYLSTTL